MRFLIDRWRGIGTRLYVALAFAVVLTLVSSAVGVYYFERSGDLNYEAEAAVGASPRSLMGSREPESRKASADALGLETAYLHGPVRLRLKSKS